MSEEFQSGEIVYHRTFGDGIVAGPHEGGASFDVWFTATGETKTILPFALFRNAEAASKFNGASAAGLRSSVYTEPDLPVFNAAAFAHEDVPVRRFLDGRNLVPWEGVTLLMGDGATGKSLLLLQLLCGVSLTATWLGRSVQTGRALYFSAEDSKDETHIRLNDIARSSGFSIADLSNLEISFMAGRDCILARLDRATGTIKPTPLFEKFRSRAKAFRPSLIGIDNLIDVYAGNVIDPALAKQFMHLLTSLSIECGCPVLLLAHPSKSGMANGDGDGGTRAWSNSARARLYLERERKLIDGETVEDDPDLRILSTRKANYGPVGTQVRIRWEDGCFIAVDEPRIETGDPLAQATKAERVFMHLLKWHLQREKFVSPNKSVSYAPKVFASHPQAEGVKARQFEAAMTILLDQRRIEIYTHGSPSSRRQHIGFPFDTHPDGGDDE